MSFMEVPDVVVIIETAFSLNCLISLSSSFEALLFELRRSIFRISLPSRSQKAYPSAKIV